MSKKMPSIIGGSFIIAGTAIGAGMLANPTATSGIWFIGSVLVLIITWLTMLSSGLMILEVNTHYPSNANFDTMVKDLLGQGWNIINGLSVAFVLYILLYAYIFVGGNLTTQGLGSLFNSEMPLAIGQILFFVILASCVFISTRWVDRLNAILIGGLIIAFVWATSGLIPQVKIPVLFDTIASNDTQYWIYLATALPVCLASFGYHSGVSSLFKYFKGDFKKVSRSLWIGTLLALTIYIIWQLATQGNLPRNEFGPAIQAKDNASALISTLANFTNLGNIESVLSFFAYFAIATSFLGVALGLFDYIADIFKWKNDLSGRSKTAFVVFTLPLVSCLLFPTGFMTAIGYVGLFCTVFTLITPALLVYQSRKKYPENKGFKAFGGNTLVIWVLLFAVINIAAQIFSRLNWVPTFSGQ